MRAKIVCGALAGLALGVGLTVVAGPLNPLAGPVAATHKTLTDVEPRTAVNAANTPGDVGTRHRITRRGSCYLDRSWNFTTPLEIGSRNGITIEADNMTLDMRGFSTRAINNARHAIQVTAGRARVRVHDGHLDNWGSGAWRRGVRAR